MYYYIKNWPKSCGARVLIPKAEGMVPIAGAGNWRGSPFGCVGNTHHTLHRPKVVARTKTPYPVPDLSPSPRSPEEPGRRGGVKKSGVSGGGGSENTSNTLNLTVRSPGGAIAHLCDRLAGARSLSPSSKFCTLGGSGHRV